MLKIFLLMWERLTELVLSTKLFSNSTNYLTRCREFALKANDGVSQVLHPPVLIIIQNKASLAQTQNHETITSKFFEIHGQEAAALRPYFSEIKCFCLPHRDQIQRTKNGILDGHAIFGEQMTDMKEILLTIRNRNAERSLTHGQWLYLLQRVLQIVQSGNSVSLHTLLSEIVVQDDDETIGIVRRCFLFTYSIKNIHSRGWFDQCSQRAMRVMAHCLATKAYHQRELMSERIIREQCQRALEQLACVLDEFQPCEALYTGKGRSAKNEDAERPVFCYKHKGVHGAEHRTCQSRHGWNFWKELMGWVSTDVWPGEFLSSARNEDNLGFLSNICVDRLSSTIKESMNAFQQDPKAIYSAFINVLTGFFLEKPNDIFSLICFCTGSTTSASLSSNRLSNTSTPIQMRRQQMVKQLTQYMIVRFRFPSSYCPWIACRVCCGELATAWDEWSLLTRSSTASSFAPLPRETSDCAICFEGNRDFLFTPCGHRGFCETCADNLLRTNPLCPFCRSPVAAKQRVHDVWHPHRPKFDLRHLHCSMRRSNTAFQINDKHVVSFVPLMTIKQNPRV